MKNARYTNGILRDPTSGRCEDLCFNDLLVSLEITSFMNNYSLPMLRKASDRNQGGGGNNGSSSHFDSSNNQSGEGDGYGASTSGKRKNRSNDGANGNDISRTRRKVINDNVTDTRSTAVDHAMFRKGAYKCADSNIKYPKTNGVEDCNNWFNKGVCHQDCPRAASHIRLRGEGLSSWKTYSAKVAEKARNLPAST